MTEIRLACQLEPVLLHLHTCQVCPVGSGDQVAKPLVRDLMADDVCTPPQAICSLRALHFQQPHQPLSSLMPAEGEGSHAQAPK